MGYNRSHFIKASLSHRGFATFSDLIHSIPYIPSVRFGLYFLRIIYIICKRIHIASIRPPFEWLRLCSSLSWALILFLSLTLALSFFFYSHSFHFQSHSFSFFSLFKLILSLAFSTCLSSTNSMLSLAHHSFWCTWQRLQLQKHWHYHVTIFAFQFCINFVPFASVFHFQVKWLFWFYVLNGKTYLNSKFILGFASFCFICFFKDTHTHSYFLNFVGFNWICFVLFHQWHF